jgi:hypothetical protein
VSYAFFDDNVLYDSAYSGLENEGQNEIEPRIQEDTPALRTQHIFYGAETEVKRIAEEMRASGMIPGAAGSVPPVQPIADKQYALSAPLGTTALYTDKMPAWQVRFFAAEMTGSVSYATGSHPTTRIPQLTSHVTYRTMMGRVNEDVRSDNLDINAQEEYTMVTSLFSDGTYFRTIGDQLLLEIDEKNTDFFKDNFTVEVFEIQEVDVTGSINTPSILKPAVKEVLKPLRFRKKYTNVKNDILIDNEKVQLTKQTPEDVAYYFDVNVDTEIPPETLCAIIARLKEQGQELGYLDTLDIDCPDIEVPFSLYASNVTEEDIEPCVDD